MAFRSIETPDYVYREEVNIFNLNGLGTFTGPTGDTGLQGPVGATGKTPTGPKGPTGVQGNQGPLGLQGRTGVQGPIGSKGPTGNQGNQGIIGSQGKVGPTGIIGIIGSQGPQGILGNTGNQGNQGPFGLTGFQGLQGITGVLGATGTLGGNSPTGVVGLPGLQGITGDTGSIGNTGPTGAIGLQGVQGPPKTGVTGPTGTKGIVGGTGSIPNLIGGTLQVTSSGPQKIIGMVPINPSLASGWTTVVDTDSVGRVTAVSADNYLIPPSFTQPTSGAMLVRDSSPVGSVLSWATGTTFNTLTDVQVSASPGTLSYFSGNNKWTNAGSSNSTVPTNFLLFSSSAIGQTGSVNPTVYAYGAPITGAAGGSNRFGGANPIGSIPVADMESYFDTGYDIDTISSLNGRLPNNPVGYYQDTIYAPGRRFTAWLTWTATEVGQTCVLYNRQGSDADIPTGANGLQPTPQVALTGAVLLGNLNYTGPPNGVNPTADYVSCKAGAMSVSTWVGEVITTEIDVTTTDLNLQLLIFAGCPTVFVSLFAYFTCTTTPPTVNLFQFPSTSNFSLVNGDSFPVGNLMAYYVRQTFYGTA